MRSAPIEVFEAKPQGTVLSEGAGAVLLVRGDSSQVELETVEAGSHFARQRDATACVKIVLARLVATNQDVIIASANGTFVDTAEAAALRDCCPEARVYSPKPALGESVGASTLWQLICGAMALQHQQLPPKTFAAGGEQSAAASSRNHPFKRAIVSACGMNQQVAAASLVLRS